MATLKVSVSTTISDEIKTTRNVISSSTSSTVISAESSSSNSGEDDSQTILTATTTTTTTTVSDGDGETEPVVAVKTPRSGRTPRAKIYRVKNLNWYCPSCDVYCNSMQQHEVHMISQKHELAAGMSKLSLSDEPSTAVDRQAVARIKEADAETEEPRRKALNPIIEFNLIAAQCKIDATKYLIPAAKKIGKFEKFGFYCGKCDAYMTGQIQLVMHVRGAKHQFFSPNEIPDYTPNKTYNPPSQKRHERRVKYVSQKTNFFKAVRDGDRLLTFFNQNMSASSSFCKDYFYNQIMANASSSSISSSASYNKTSSSQSRRRSRTTTSPIFARDYPFDVCFYDYFFKSQDLIHNQNYHHHYSYASPASFASPAAYPMPQPPPPAPQLQPAPFEERPSSSADGSASSADFSSDQASWSSYSGTSSPAGTPYLVGQYHQHHQPAPAYFSPQSNQSTPPPMSAQSSPASTLTADGCYRLFAKAHSSRLVQLSPGRNNGVSMLVTNDLATARRPVASSPKSPTSAAAAAAQTRFFATTAAAAASYLPAAAPFMQPHPFASYTVY